MVQPPALGMKMWPRPHWVRARAEEEEEEAWWGGFEIQVSDFGVILVRPGLTLLHDIYLCMYDT